MDITKRQQSGFTLIEVILSLVLVGIMSVVAGMGIVFFAKGFVLAKEATHTVQKAQLAMGRLTRELTELSSIAAGSDTGTIVFTNKLGNRQIGLDGHTIKIADSSVSLTEGDDLIDNIATFSLQYWKDLDVDAWDPAADDIDDLSVLRVTFTVSDVGGSFSIIVFPRNI